MANTYTNLLYHIIFSTKNRRPIIQPSFRDELEQYITGIIQAEGCALVEIGGMPDHLHIVARFRPDRSVSEMVRLIKANSSKWVNETRGLAERFEWQTGYGAFTVSQSQLDKLRAYVRGQEEHHHVRSFQEEYLEFLERHGITYDERYVWG
jgi:REP element-mobilizing transposase RayT